MDSTSAQQRVEVLDQSITSILQEIDEDFTKSHKVAQEILSSLKRYSAHSKVNSKMISMWSEFFTNICPTFSSSNVEQDEEIKEEHDVNTSTILDQSIAEMFQTSITSAPNSIGMFNISLDHSVISPLSPRTQSSSSSSAQYMHMDTSMDAMGIFGLDHSIVDDSSEQPQYNQHNQPSATKVFKQMNIGKMTSHIPGIEFYHDDSLVSDDSVDVSGIQNITPIKTKTKKSQNKKKVDNNNNVNDSLDLSYNENSLDLSILRKYQTPMAPKTSKPTSKQQQQQQQQQPQLKLGNDVEFEADNIDVSVNVSGDSLMGLSPLRSTPFIKRTRNTAAITPTTTVTKRGRVVTDPTSNNNNNDTDSKLNVSVRRSTRATTHTIRDNRVNQSPDNSVDVSMDVSLAMGELVDLTMDTSYLSTPRTTRVSRHTHNTNTDNSAGGEGGSGRKRPSRQVNSESDDTDGVQAKSGKKSRFNPKVTAEMLLASSSSSSSLSSSSGNLGNDKSNKPLLNSSKKTPTKPVSLWDDCDSSLDISMSSPLKTTTLSYNASLSNGKFPISAKKTPRRGKGDTSDAALIATRGAETSERGKRIKGNNGLDDSVALDDSIIGTTDLNESFRDRRARRRAGIVDNDIVTNTVDMNDNKKDNKTGSYDSGMNDSFDSSFNASFVTHTHTQSLVPDLDLDLFPKTYRSGVGKTQLLLVWTAVNKIYREICMNHIAKHGSTININNQLLWMTYEQLEPHLFGDLSYVRLKLMMDALANQQLVDKNYNRSTKTFSWKLLAYSEEK